jgi:hypothetical protein
MTVERVTPVIPVNDLASAVATWSVILGTEPTFVDGDRWAQFDVGASRIALAGADRTTDATGVMIKVDDLAASHGEFTSAGMAPGDMETGAHEVRFFVEGPGAPATLYSSIPQ